MTVAIALLLLAHVPPDEGDNVVVVPIHILLVPVILTVGTGMIAILVIGSEGHPAVEVKVKIAVP